MIVQHALDLFRGVEFAFAHSGAKLHHFVVPGAAFHVFGPEGPGATLGRSPLVYRASISLQKVTVARGIFEVEPPIGIVAVSSGKLAGGDLKKPC